MNAVNQVQSYLRGPLNVKDISDWIKIAVLIGSMIFGYSQLVGRVDSSIRAIDAMQKQTQRIERYLSSKDPQYWDKVKDYTDP